MLPRLKFNLPIVYLIMLMCCSSILLLLVGLLAIVQQQQNYGDTFAMLEEYHFSTTNYSIKQPIHIYYNHTLYI